MLTYDLEVVKVERVVGRIKAIGELSNMMTILPLSRAVVIISGELVLNTCGNNESIWYKQYKSLIEVMASCLIEDKPSKTLESEKRS